VCNNVLICVVILLLLLMTIYYVVILLMCVLMINVVICEWLLLMCNINNDSNVISNINDIMCVLILMCV